MNFQSPFINPYGIAPQYQPPVVQAAVQQVVRVNGEGGARAYQIGGEQLRTPAGRGRPDGVAGDQRRRGVQDGPGVRHYAA